MDDWKTLSDEDLRNLLLQLIPPEGMKFSSLVKSLDLSIRKDFTHAQRMFKIIRQLVQEMKILRRHNYLYLW